MSSSPAKPPRPSRRMRHLLTRHRAALAAPWTPEEAARYAEFRRRWPRTEMQIRALDALARSGRLRPDLARYFRLPDDESHAR